VFRTVCVAEPSKARNVLPRHKAAQKISIQVHKQVQSNVEQACHEHKPKLKRRFALKYYFKHDRWHVTTTSQSWNAGACYTNAVKRDVHLLLNREKLEIALSSSDDKINTLALVFRACGALGGQGGKDRGPDWRQRKLGKMNKSPLLIAIHSRSYGRFCSLCFIYMCIHCKIIITVQQLFFQIMFFIYQHFSKRN